MALNTNALTTKSAVKDELGITDSSQDAYIETLINRASAAIEAYCSRKFYYEANIVENLPGYGGVQMVLSRKPIISVVSVYFNASLIDPVTYEIHDAEAGILRFLQGLTWTALLLPDVGRDPYPGSERNLYQATYTAGWVTPAQGTPSTPLLPSDIEEACVITVVDRYRRKGRDPSIKSESLMSYSVSYREDMDTNRSGLPPAARAMIDAYRKPVFS